MFHSATNKFIVIVIIGTICTFVAFGIGIGYLIAKC